MVYRVANCLCLHLSSPTVDGLMKIVWWLIVCACTSHHPLWVVYRVACLCLHLSSPSVDGLQGDVSVRTDHLQVVLLLGSRAFSLRGIQDGSDTPEKEREGGGGDYSYSVTLSPPVILHYDGRWREPL